MYMFVTYHVFMINLNINEVKANLSSCLARIAKGEKVIICKRNKPVAEIRPIRTPTKKKRPIGLAKKEYPAMALDNSFFNPLPDDIVDAFSGRGT